MAQRAQVIDITKTYLPGDPNTFVQNLVNTDREDGEEKTLPILAYEGYNFLPTSYGYKSYFGSTTELDIALLDKKVQFVLSYQLSNYQTRLIALCADGIWVCNANIADSTWTHSITLTDTPATFEEWTWCVIENILYMYRQGQASAWKTGEAAGEITISTHTPSFLTMSGQMGIFRAGTRLGFWDSANSVSWSSNLDLTDFTPSLENLAGNTIFADVIGRIITIRSQGEGYIVYSSRSITGVNFDTSGNMLWDAKKIFDNAGISYSRAITYGQTDNEHLVYATNGFYRIGKFNSLSGKHEIELIAPEVYDFLKKSRDPIYLDTINSRYVFFHILNPDYVYGLTSFTYVSPEDLNVRFMIGGHPWDGEALPAICIDGNAAAEAIRQLVTFGFVTINDTTALWSVTVSITQPDTDGPLGPGATFDPVWFNKTPQTPRFTTQDILDSYITGATLPGELDPTSSEVGKYPGTSHLGNVPQGDVTISGTAAPVSVTRWMHLQNVDWELFRQHQTAAFARVEAATSSETTEGVTAYYAEDAAGLPDLPASTSEDTLIDTYRTGAGNVEIQLDKPLRKLVMRKYFQEGRTVTKRTVTSYVWRDSGNTVGGKKVEGSITMIASATYAPVPQSFNLAMGVYLPDSSYSIGALNTLAIAQASAQCPATMHYSGDGIDHDPRSFANLTSNNGPWAQFSPVAYYTYGPQYVNQQNLDHTSTTLKIYYQDTVETYTYIIGDAVTANHGSADFEITQTVYGSTIVNITVDPAEIVAHSEIPVSATGPTDITFSEPAWEGEQTLKLLSATSLSPWHYFDGTFGDKVIEVSVAGGETQLESLGGCDLLGDGFIPADYGLTYSSFPYVLQVGAPFIYYPTFAGSLVLDLALKKWGKQKNSFQVLIDFQPLNQFNHVIFTADDEGMDAGIHLVDETIKIFDDLPADSIIRYGKIGSYRLGMTDILECRMQNGKACTGSLMIDSSMDGKTIDDTLRYTTTYSSARVVEAYPDISARWHVVSISGNYDLTGLEVRTKLAGRR